MAQANRGLAEAVPEPRTEAHLAPAEDFDAFFEDAYPLLMKVAMAVGASVEEAEDAANETMKYAYEHWGKIRSHRAYVRRAVTNAVAKAKGRDKERVARTIAGGQATSDIDDDTSLTVWEDQDWVLHHLQTLPPAQRQVMACFVDGLSSAEIAALLGKTEAAVRKNLQLARERLKRQLADEQYHELHYKPSGREVTRRETR